jgi:hypothetical protein
MVYPGELPERLGIDKSQARFMSRVARRAARGPDRGVRGRVATDARAPRGTGDVETHRETDGSRGRQGRRVAPRDPWLMP